MPAGGRLVQGARRHQQAALAAVGRSRARHRHRVRRQPWPRHRARGLARGRSGDDLLPSNVSPEKVGKLERWGAQTRIVGAVWDDSNRAALAHAEASGAVYFHPFADPLVVAGQGTVGLEMLEQDPDIGTIVVAIGGGGLISGIATAAKAMKPSIRVIGVEPSGAPTLHACLEAGRLVALDRIATAVPTLAALQTDERIFDVVRRSVDRIVLIEDEDMRSAARWLWFELGIAADLGGAAAVAALLSGRLKTAAGERVCALIGGAGADGITG